MRQIILDTETTGLRPEDGHRIIEIGCLEMVNRRLTGNQFHYYINPEREVEAAAEAVHGISSDFLQDKPLFKDVAAEFIAYIDDAELIIHNAPFDVGFLNHELQLLKSGYKRVVQYCKVTDTLAMARKKHVGQRNSLDALCKRYFVDNSRRDLHGALIDCNLLAQVYLAMTGGQESMFAEPGADAEGQNKVSGMAAKLSLEGHQTLVIAATAGERGEHDQYLSDMQEKGDCLWLKEE